MTMRGTGAVVTGAFGALAARRRLVASLTLIVTGGGKIGR
jgi:hypothetical protein